MARDRKTEPKTLVRLMRGDLDSISLKALEKERVRRYGSPADFAADLERYLKNEPVLAPSAAYRARKFARRYRVALATVRAFAMVLLAATVVSVRQSIRANREAATAQAISDFMQNDLLAQAISTAQALGGGIPDPDLKVRTALDPAAARIEGKFDRQPEVEATIRDTMGQAYQDLSLYDESRKQPERAVFLYASLLGPEGPRTLRCITRLGYTLGLQGNSAEAEPLLSKNLEISRRVLGREHPYTLECMEILGLVYGGLRQHTQAETLHSEVLNIRRRVLGPEHRVTLRCALSLLADYCRLGKFREAETLAVQTLEIRRRVLGAEHPDKIMTMGSLAGAYGGQGRYREAEAMQKQILDIQRRLLGPDNFETLKSMGNLAINYENCGKFAEAEALKTETLKSMRRVFGIDHPNTLWSMSALADLYAQMGNFDQAEGLTNQALEIRQRTLGPEHPDTLASMAVLSDVHTAQGKSAQAEAILRKILTVRPKHAAALKGLAWLLTADKNPGDRRPQEALELAGRAEYAAPTLAGNYTTLGLAEYRNNLWDKAISTLNKSVEMNKGTDPNDFFFLAMAHLGRGYRGDAERLFQRAVEVAGKNPLAEQKAFWAETAKLIGKPGPPATQPTVR